MLIKHKSVIYAGILSLFSSMATLADDNARLRELIVGEHRSPANVTRNDARHPVETLEFFGLKSGQTVIEILPSGGWYTEILAPFLKGNGIFYAAHFSPNSHLAYQPRNLEAFEALLASRPDIYGETILTRLYPPTETAIAPPDSADLAMTFRNVHNWIMAGTQSEHFAAFYEALKSGGILGVVEHRAPAGSSMEFMSTTGYVTQDYVIELAEAAGFEFVASSEINANPLDTKDYPEGVWTLPPTSRLGEVDRDKYLAIGESDRMTLKFRKP
ncbi:MAG: methyltransferase [Gammaproteobacteria bacterium]|nr:methyltransferase [Gammaproteobacteria bacterium]MDP2140646.1 methyltransferase [Gammaproteobacteria bacterium]MDP2347418.1 methyltransferase [Gammaproteobacteria bacterium]